MSLEVRIDNVLHVYRIWDSKMVEKEKLLWRGEDALVMW